MNERSFIFSTGFILLLSLFDVVVLIESAPGKETCPEENVFYVISKGRPFIVIDEINQESYGKSITAQI